MSLFINFVASANQILTAGIVITAFSFLLYALTFNLRERVARAFAALLAFVTVVYFCDVVVSTLRDLALTEIWLRWQWAGIAFIPAAYLHFTDALLATTGLPSRGRRRRSIQILYITAGVFLVAAVFSRDLLVADGLIESGAAHLRAGWLFPVFLVYVLGCLGWAGWNFERAYHRCLTSATRRRMIYLMTSAAAPALGTFPFLLVIGQTAALHPLIFWNIVVVTNFAVLVLLMVMAYAVAYFGVTLPDRVVKARLFHWTLRGPVAASILLTIYVLVSRYGPRLSFYDARAIPFFLIGGLLALQFLITLVSPPLERMLFYGSAQGELQRLRTVEERLLASGDLRQLLEAVLAGLCDALRSPAAFVAAFGQAGKVEYEVQVGKPAVPLSADLPPLADLRAAEGEALTVNLFAWGDYWLMPLYRQVSGEPLGLLGVRAVNRPLGADELAVLKEFAARAASALEDLWLQREVFNAVDRLLPHIETLRQLRAATAYAVRPSPAAAQRVMSDPDLAQTVKDALSHYWGGPKLTDSPLMRLRVVEQALQAHDGNTVNALRAVLREAIERLRPEGQRKFTTEWILYNILEMKFLQNRRVREVAMRLAVSEADLYRKQRVAMEEVARAIQVMEEEAAERPDDYEVAG